MCSRAALCTAMAANKKKGASALTNEIHKLETGLDKDPDNFEHYGELIELQLRDGNNVRAKILLEQVRREQRSKCLLVNLLWHRCHSVNHLALTFSDTTRSFSHSQITTP